MHDVYRDATCVHIVNDAMNNCNLTAHMIKKYSDLNENYNMKIIKYVLSLSFHRTGGEMKVRKK